MNKKQLKYRIELLKKFITHPKSFVIFLASKGIIEYDDKYYIAYIFEEKFNKEINLDNPQTFNEKLQWLKLYDRKEIYTTMVDKYKVKKYVANIIGEEYIIPTLGIYDKFEDINFDKLPNQFVIKCTHDSGGLIIVKDKFKIDIESAKKKINKCLKRNYFYKYREWPYKNIKPRIIVEKYIKDELIEDLRDYKFMCFNGEVKYVYVTVKNDDIFENYYDLDFNPVMINHGFRRYEKEFKKPENFEIMVEIAKKLSKNVPFLRVDLHNVKGKIYFGEMTFYDWGGLRTFPDEKIDIELGKLIDVGLVKNEK